MLLPAIGDFFRVHQKLNGTGWNGVCERGRAYLDWIWYTVNFKARDNQGLAKTVVLEVNANKISSALLKRIGCRCDGQYLRERRGLQCVEMLSRRKLRKSLQVRSATILTSQLSSEVPLPEMPVARKKHHGGLLTGQFFSGGLPARGFPRPSHPPVSRPWNGKWKKGETRQVDLLAQPQNPVPNL